MHIHTGNAYVRFGASMGTSISGITYRLSQVGKDKWEGTSDEAGHSQVLWLLSSRDNSMQESDHNHAPLPDHHAWCIQGSSDIVSIAIEVKRDNGTWKKIGSFQIEVGKEKLIHAEIGTVAMPFSLALVNS